MRSVGRAAGRKGAASADRYIYMAQPWILSMYLDCPKGMGFTCPDPGDVAKLEAGIRRGDITWNGFPFNAQLELFEPSLLTAAMEITRSLDRRFGVPPTATVSQRDVPGATAAAIPLLCSQGAASEVEFPLPSAAPGSFQQLYGYFTIPSTIFKLFEASLGEAALCRKRQQHRLIVCILRLRHPGAKRRHQFSERAAGRAAQHAVLLARPCHWRVAACLLPPWRLQRAPLGHRHRRQQRLRAGAGL